MISTREKNYFKILEIDASTPENDIRKAFRKLSVTKHPDKIGKQGEQEYHDIVRAYDVLRDPEARKEYEKLLVEGVPFSDQYYGRYAHKYGAPDADVRYVILGLLVFVSVAQYGNQYYKHVTYHEYAKKTFRYQQALKVREHERKINKKKAKKGGQEDDEEEEEEGGPAVIIRGAEKPQIKDVILVKLALSPYYITRAAYNLGIWAKQGFPKNEIDADTLAREQAGMDEDEWEEHKQKYEENKQRMMESNRYKRYKRWLKKQS